MKPRVRRVRQRIVAAAMGALRTQPHWNYGMVRPIPYERFMELLDGKDVTIETDCSGLATLAYFRAGAPDPNGLNYDGQGFTGDMLNHLPDIPLNRAKPGDLAVFVTPEKPDGEHVVIIVEDPAQHPDPQCVSHGGQGDPKIAPLSHFRPLGHLVVLRGVSRHTIPRPFRQAKWRVYGDGGRLVGKVYTTKLLWAARHRRVVKRQHESLHFRRIHRS